MTELVVMSFAYSRGDPPDANLVFDVRFLRNPHWQEELRPLSGLDAAVGLVRARSTQRRGVEFMRPW